MPKRFAPEQIAASAAVGELRTQHSFGGDTEAWHNYQDTVYSKLRPGEALHANRAVLWKAAARQLKKIEAEINTPVKKLKLSTRKQYPGVSDVHLSSPRPSACGKHVVCRLTANVNGYGRCFEDVHYEQPPAEGESDKHKESRRPRCVSTAIGAESKSRSRGSPTGICEAPTLNRVATTGMACTLQKVGGRQSNVCTTYTKDLNDPSPGHGP